MFGAKFGVPPNPIAQEPTAKEIRPTDGALRRALEAHLQHLSETNNNAGFTEVINKYRGKEKIREARTVVKKDFQHRFDAFLLGRMDPAVGTRTRGMPYTKTPGWGNRNTSIMNNSEVRQYINDKDTARAMFDRHIFVMRALGTAVGYDPETGAYWAPGLEEWYLYYKYVLEDNSHDDAEYLADYKKYRNRLTPSNDHDKKYYNLGGFGEHPPPDRSAVHQFAEFTGEPLNPNIMPVGDANPGHFGPEDHDGYWRTDPDRYMENRARTRKDIIAEYKTAEGIASQKTAAGANLAHPPDPPKKSTNQAPLTGQAAILSILDPKSNAGITRKQQVAALVAAGMDQADAEDLTKFWKNMSASKHPDDYKAKVVNSLHRVYGADDDDIPTDVIKHIEDAAEQRTKSLGDKAIQSDINNTTKQMENTRKAYVAEQNNLKKLRAEYKTALEAAAAVGTQNTQAAEDIRQKKTDALAALEASHRQFKSGGGETIEEDDTVDDLKYDQRQLQTKHTIDVDGTLLWDVERILNTQTPFPSPSPDGNQQPPPNIDMSDDMQSVEGFSPAEDPFQTALTKATHPDIDFQEPQVALQRFLTPTQINALVDEDFQTEIAELEKKAFHPVTGEVVDKAAYKKYENLVIGPRVESNTDEWSNDELPYLRAAVKKMNAQIAAIEQEENELYKERRKVLISKGSIDDIDKRLGKLAAQKNETQARVGQRIGSFNARKDAQKNRPTYLKLKADKIENLAKQTETFLKATGLLERYNKETDANKRRAMKKHMDTLVQWNAFKQGMSGKSSSYGTELYGKYLIPEKKNFLGKVVRPAREVTRTLDYSPADVLDKYGHRVDESDPNYKALREANIQLLKDTRYTKIREKIDTAMKMYQEGVLTDTANPQLVGLMDEYVDRLRRGQTIDFDLLDGIEQEIQHSGAMQVESFRELFGERPDRSYLEDADDPENDPVFYDDDGKPVPPDKAEEIKLKAEADPSAHSTIRYGDDEMPDLPDSDEEDDVKVEDFTPEERAERAAAARQAKVENARKRIIDAIDQKIEATPDIDEDKLSTYTVETVKSEDSKLRKRGSITSTDTLDSADLRRSAKRTDAQVRRQQHITNSRLAVQLDAPSDDEDDDDDGTPVNLPPITNLGEAKPAPPNQVLQALTNMAPNRPPTAIPTITPDTPAPALAPPPVGRPGMTRAEFQKEYPGESYKKWARGQTEHIWNSGKNFQQVVNDMWDDPEALTYMQEILKPQVKGQLDDSHVEALVRKWQNYSVKPDTPNAPDIQFPQPPPPAPVPGKPQPIPPPAPPSQAPIIIPDTPPTASNPTGQTSQPMTSAATPATPAKMVPYVQPNPDDPDQAPPDVQEYVGDNPDGDYYSHPIRGDGNCLYRALATARALYLDPGNASDAGWPDIKTWAHGYMRHYPALFQHLVPDGNVEDYVAAQSQPDVWGEPAEIQALANIFGTIIVVQNYEGGKMNWAGSIVTAPNGPNQHGETNPPQAVLHLRFRGGNHYETLQPYQDDRYVPTNPVRPVTMATLTAPDTAPAAPPPPPPPPPPPATTPSTSTPKKPPRPGSSALRLGASKLRKTTTKKRPDPLLNQAMQNPLFAAVRKHRADNDTPTPSPSPSRPTTGSPLPPPPDLTPQTPPPAPPPLSFNMNSLLDAKKRLKRISRASAKIGEAMTKPSAKPIGGMFGDMTSNPLFQRAAAAAAAAENSGPNKKPKPPKKK